MTNTLTSHKVEEGELPSGWAVSRLGDLAGLSPKVPGDLLEANTDLSFVPMAAVTEVSGEVDLTQTIAAQEGKKRSLKYFADGDVIFAKITPCMENGKVARASGLINGAAFGSTEFHVLRPTPAIDGDFLRLFLVHDDFRYEAERAMTGAVGQRRVPKKYLEDFPLPTPPLPEQERIVEILEDQLSRLDTALESVRAVREKAAQFRRSLLHTAFTGALTGHDVEEGELPTDWQQVSLVELLADQKYALAIGPFGSNLKRSDYRPSGVPLVFVRNIRANDFDLSPVYVARAKANDLSAHVVREGDVLVTKMGDPPGDTTIYPFNRPDAVITADCIKVTSDPGVVSNRYLSLAIGSPIGAAQIRQMSGGVAQQKVNLAKFRKLQIPLAPRKEQDRIVEILEDQLSRLDASLATADAVEERSAALRRSLLHSAFTGRLTREWREAVNV